MLFARSPIHSDTNNRKREKEYADMLRLQKYLAETTAESNRHASSSATADLPEAVGPTTAITSGKSMPAKPLGDKGPP